MASVKFLMSQNPKIAITFLPGNIGLIDYPLEFIFDATIYEPASPNPNANNAPILTINF